MDKGFESLIAQISMIVKLSEDDVHRIASELYRDGIVSLSEADALFDVNSKLVGADTAWDRLFVGAIKDFVLYQSDPKNWVTDDEADWLIARVARNGQTPLGSEVDLLLQIIRYAEGAPDHLRRFILRAACDRIVAAGNAAPEDVERVRRALIVPATEEAMLWITAAEADLLLRTNDSIAFAHNHVSWNDLFARAVSNHLLARAHPDPHKEADRLSREHWLGDMRPEKGCFFESIKRGYDDSDWFGAISRDSVRAEAARRAAHATHAPVIDLAEVDVESDWFLKHVGMDKNISPAERALIDFLEVEAPGFTQGLAVAA